MENLDVAVRRSGGDRGKSQGWTLERVFDLFPKLRELVNGRAATCRAASSRC